MRGKQRVERGDFEQDPVVGWLVVVGGPGIGSYRPIFEGNNTLGRSPSNRIPIDFGDDAISSDEQAYIRYDSAPIVRSFSCRILPRPTSCPSTPSARRAPLS